MADLQSKYRPFCFDLRYFIFLLFHIYFELFGQRISQTATESRKIPTESQSGMREPIRVCLLLPKLCFIFQLFRVEWKTHRVNFLYNYLTNRRIICLISSRHSSSAKNVRHGRRLPHILSPFSRKMCHLEKTEKKLDIYYNIQPMFIKFLTKMMAISLAM